MQKLNTRPLPHTPPLPRSSAHPSHQTPTARRQWVGSVMINSGAKHPTENASYTWARDTTIQLNEHSHVRLIARTLGTCGTSNDLCEHSPRHHRPQPKCTSPLASRSTGTMNMNPLLGQASPLDTKQISQSQVSHDAGCCAEYRNSCLKSSLTQCIHCRGRQIAKYGNKFS